MYELDFLQVSTTEKSGDAIVIRFTVPGFSRPLVVVVDGGYGNFGPEVVAHVRRHFGDRVDLVVSTHPDADHINGLTAVIEQLDVGYLLLHRPKLHGYTSSDVKADVAEELATLATRRGVDVISPFTGLQAFGGALTVVGPTEDYYLELLEEALIEKAAATAPVAAGGLAVKSVALAQRQLSFLPPETLLDDDGGTRATNNSSVVLSLQVDGERMLLTGDAGVPALHRALDYIDYAGLAATPLGFMQAPHHGSRHNLDAPLLNRLLGPPGTPITSGVTAFISASADAPKHPSPKVSNALMRRGASVYSTEMGHLSHRSVDAPLRLGWGPAPQIGPRNEAEPGDRT